MAFVADVLKDSISGERNTLRSPAFKISGGERNTLSETDIAFKKAFIKFVNVECPKLRESMDRLSRQIHLMPTTVRMRP